MNPSRPFILRPVATTLLMVALLLAGLVGYRALSISALPQVDYPTIQVVTLYPGAGPEVTTAAITAPLEKQFGQMPGLKQMASQSSGGASVVTLQFDLSLSLDVAEQEVQAAINAANTLLPSDLPNPPIYNKVNPADPPVLTLAVTAKNSPMTKVEDLVDTRVAQKISQVSGVGLVTLSGGQRPAVRINFNPQALAVHNIDSESIRTAISAANVNVAKGGFDGPARASTIDANDQLQSAADYRNVIVAYNNGAPIRLQDVAEVVDGAENAKLAAWANHDPAIILNVQRQPGANVIQTVDHIRALLPSLQQGLPADVKVTVLTDRTNTIRASIKDVQFELTLAVVLVVMVIFVFLRNVRATIIPSVAVPLSLIGTFGIMYLVGFSINNLTLMALTIATGFVVDDAIVVIENIARYIEQGDNPLEAALKGAGEIGFTIISLTFSLVAVLIPLLFMQDVVGRLFREFAITLAVSILLSAVISLTLTPMMCAKLLRHETEDTESRFARWSEHFFNSMIARYARYLEWVLNHQKLTLLVAASTLAVTVLLYIAIPKGFFPIQDNGAILGITEASQSISFDGMAQKQQQVADVLLGDDDVESLSSFIGIDGTNATLNSGRVQINLKPLDARKDRAPAIIQRLQAELDKVPGIKVYLQPVQDLTIETSVSRTQYQFTLQAGSMDELSEWVPKLVQRLQAEPALADVVSDLQDKGLVAYLQIDRDAAAQLGVTVAAIDSALYNAYGQRLISTIFTQSNQYRVVIGVDKRHTLGADSLNDIRIATTSGATIPLATVARVVERNGALAVNHLAQFPSTTISFNLGHGASLGDAVQAIDTAKADINLPADLITSFQGSALAFKAALSNEVWLILAAIIVMYIVLGVLYESYIHPVTILSTLPTAGVGALLALIVARQDLSVIAIIGIILLIGIVKKNAIMMIDFALAAERERGLESREAIFEACKLRFRPILMTTMAALLGALPLMLSMGEGAELRRPLGIAMVGGLIVSQVLTLFTTPVIYLAFDRLARRLQSRSSVQDAAA